MDIAISGNIDINDDKYTIHNMLKPGYTLYVGSQCNDGRPITHSWRYKQAIKLGIPIIHPSTKTYNSKNMFVTKYSPTSIADIIGHKEQMNQIHTWLKNFEKLEKRSILVTGPPGIGKTSAVHLIIKNLGYKVTEYNASDVRSKLCDIIAVGNKRLVKEVIVIDEIDGLSTGIGELALTIKKTTTPIICIANDRTKLKPIINVSIDIKFHRPLKSIIASSLLKIVKAENIEITKPELELLCERNGNDIRSILNILEFYGVSGDKDTNFDLFTATQKLFGNTLSMDDAADIVFSDYNMVPLMVQESYINASRTLEEASIASDFISDGDVIDTRGRETNDWNVLPYYAQSTVAASKSVSGSTYVRFSSWLGKNSKKLKHQRFMKDFSRFSNFRLDYADPLYHILSPLTDIKSIIKRMDEMNITRDDIENIGSVLLEKIEIPTKTKTAFTREYNKTHTKLEKNMKEEQEVQEVQQDQEVQEDED